jgi:hypothetical protein
MKTISYSDGSGNKYVITEDSIKYEPVKQEFSSSGLYSGGEPTKKAIDHKNYDEILLICEEIFKTDSVHIPIRMMTSGCLDIISEVKVKDAKISSQKVFFKNCELKTKLENRLKKHLK